MIQARSQQTFIGLPSVGMAAGVRPPVVVVTDAARAATLAAAPVAANAQPGPRFAPFVEPDPRPRGQAIPVGPKASVAVPSSGLTFHVRSAVPDDASAICATVNAWADDGLTVRRDIDEVSHAISEFVVAERGDEVLATAALVVFSPSLAEIRSVATAPAAKGLGAAVAAVNYVIDQAVSTEIDRLVLLTKIPAYFAKFGFRPIDPNDLPEDFVAEFITARRRTLVGRTVMERVLL